MVDVVFIGIYTYEHTMSTRFQIARKDITSAIDALPSSVLKRQDLADLLSEHREFWRLPVSMSTNKFIKTLLEHTKLEKAEVPYFRGGKTDLRYLWGEASPYAVALSLGKRAYLSHFTALSLHGLTNEVPKIIFVNVEQSPKRPPSGALVQSSIDRAFSHEQRSSTLRASYGGFGIQLMNGKWTDCLGVVPMEHSIGKDAVEKLRVTNIERTLIDCVVRPAYAGGPKTVLEAYRLSRGRFSVNKMKGMLAQLDYRYPYHQSIGFLLERSGQYPAELVSLFEAIPRTVDFYLDYGLRNPEYDAKWRLFYPRGMNVVA